MAQYISKEKIQSTPILKQRIELCISGKDLIGTITNSQLSLIGYPFVVVKHKHNDKEIGRTEISYDSHSPNFIKSISLDYFFEHEQELKFDVFLQIENGPNKAPYFLGSCVMNLKAIVDAPGTDYTCSMLSYVLECQDRSYNYVICI